MKTKTRMFLTAVTLPLVLTGCLGSGGTPAAAGQNSVMVSDLTSICGSIVGGQAEQRINQEWAKYPGAEANRSVIETMADVLLNDPAATEQQSAGQYKKYMTCATGLLLSNGLMK